MDFKATLSQRIHKRDIRSICTRIYAETDIRLISVLYALTDDNDNRVSYNALWVFTHLPDNVIAWLETRRDELIDRLLDCAHSGKCRLILSLLDRMPVTDQNVRSDFIDYCFSRINSTEPSGIRALCIRHAYAICRVYPDLLNELTLQFQLMEQFPLSPALISARNSILRKITAAQLKSQSDNHQ